METTAGDKGPATARASDAGTDALLMFMAVIWGSNFIAIKYSLEDMRPLSFNGMRFLIASAVLLVASRALRVDFKVKRSDRLALFGYGLLANALYQTLFITGVANTRTGNAALIVCTTPMFTAIAGRLRRQEYFTSKGVAGLVLAFGGIVLIVLSGNRAVGFGSTIFGDLLLIVSTLCWSIYTVGARRLLNTYGPMKATTIMMVCGSAVFILVCAPSLLAQDWASIRPIAWGGLLYSALLAIAVAHFIWNYAVRKIGSTRSAIYSNITPVVALLVAWPALGERPKLGQVVGAIVIFTGLYFVRTGITAAAPETVIEEELEEASLSPGRN